MFRKEQWKHFSHPRTIKLLLNSGIQLDLTTMYLL